VTDRKHFLVRFDVEKGFISSVCVQPGALSRRALPTAISRWRAKSP